MMVDVEGYRLNRSKIGSKEANNMLLGSSLI